MKLGTKSLIFGSHQFILHSMMLAFAWHKLYGFPLDPRLWIAFLVHDWGYFGRSNMDGEEGEAHPELGAKIMNFLFGPKWGNFTLLHSRTYSTLLKVPVSQLWAADKLATVLVPSQIYLAMATLTGEIDEYMNEEVAIKYSQQFVNLVKGKDKVGWLKGVHYYMKRQVAKRRKFAISVTDYPAVFLLNHKDNAGKLFLQSFQGDLQCKQHR